MEWFGEEGTLKLISFPTSYREHRHLVLNPHISAWDLACAGAAPKEGLLWMCVFEGHRVLDELNNS